MKSNLIGTHEADTRDSPDCRTYFDEISGTWEKHYTSNGSMVWRLIEIMEPVKTWVPIGGKILDFGCGAGDIAAQCATAGYQVTGIDTSPKMIERAQARFKSSGITFESCADPLRLPFEAETFDAVVASSVLEYVGPLQDQLKELRRVCKNGGRAIFTIPNASHPLRWLEAFERILVVPIRCLMPPAIRKREDQTAISINRFRARNWYERFGHAGWKVQSIAQRDKPLLLVVLENAVPSNSRL